jgi:hypothetical protein
VIQYSVNAEALQEIGRDGVMRIRRWLDASARFAISHTAYDLDPDRRPYTQVRLEQLDGRFENFDLVGDIRDERGSRGNTVYVECKKYSGAGNQGAFYNEYLTVAYSAFAARHATLQHPPSMEFMWITTHPFAQTTFSRLMEPDTIKAACADETFKVRLGGQEYDDELGGVLATRLWLVVVNDRMLDEMIMGDELRGAVLAKMVEMGTA